MEVACWDRLEIGVPNGRTYENPYEEVRLEATFRGPEGRRVEVEGFCDGAEGWKVRFMPGAVGRWTYEAAFADGAGGIDGGFDCVPSDIPGLVQAHAANPTWFGYKGGGALVVRSLHVGDCFFADAANGLSGEGWDPSMRRAFLDWARGQGYNMLSVASHYLKRDSQGRGAGWQTPELWDAGRQVPRPEEYARLEGVLADLARRHMLVYPFAGFFGRDAAFPAEAAKQETYVRYTLARLGSFWNLLLMVGGPEPHMKGKPYLSTDDINRLGRLIRDGDPYGHLLSVHNPTGDDHFGQEDWVSYVILQGPKTVDRDELAAAHWRNARPGKPLYAQETLWPGNRLHSKRIGRDYGLDDIRKNALVMLFCGASINFADMDGLSSSGFSGRPDLGLRKQAVHDAVKRAWDLFESLPYAGLAPAPERVDGGYCLASKNRLGVYVDEPGRVQLGQDRAVGGAWINAQNIGEYRPLAAAGDRELATPAGGDDWVLWLEVEPEG